MRKPRYTSILFRVNVLRHIHYWGGLREGLHTARVIYRHAKWYCAKEEAKP